MELSLLFGITVIAACICTFTMYLYINNTMTANLCGHSVSFVSALGSIISGIICVTGIILLVVASASMKHTTSIETTHTVQLIKEDPSDSYYVTRDLSRNLSKNVISYVFLTKNEDGKITHHEIEDVTYHAGVDGTTARIVETESDIPFAECRISQSKWLFLRRTEQRYSLHVSEDQIKTVTSSDGEMRG